jgi:membrane-associated progesterone receptor component
MADKSDTQTTGDGGDVDAGSSSLISSIVTEIVTSPLNLALVFVIIFLIYKIFKSSNSTPTPAPPEPKLPKLRRDFTVEEMKNYDGTQPDGRVLVAVNGNVYDVTKGKRFYGPGGPYAAFGGRDASRGLATFSITAPKDGYDDLSDLNTMEMDSVREWEEQFKEKYEWVGRLLKPGEQPTNYSDEEDESASPASGDKPKEE